MVASNIIAKPVRGFGGFYAMALDTFVAIFKPPFAWREFISQSWFVARVSIVPTLMLTIPYTVLLTFTFNILLTEFGAADFSGTGAALGTVRQIGPIVTVLVVAGAGATAMCADLGARTIREELDALRVMGVNPIQALVVPRVLAATLVSLALAATVILVGLAGAYLFCVYIQHVSPGAFAAGLTLIIGAADVTIALAKAALFGLSAGMIACYKGISVGGGPAGVGNAVNETVVFTFMALFAINVRRDRRRRKGDDVTISRPHSQFPWLKGRFRGMAEPWNRVGRQTKFYGNTLRSIYYAVTYLPDRADPADRCRWASARARSSSSAGPSRSSVS